MLSPFSNIVKKSWMADAGLRAGVSDETRRIAANITKLPKLLPTVRGIVTCPGESAVT